MMRRRRFLLGGLGLVLLASVGVVGGGFVTEWEIASAVRRRLSRLKLNEAGVRAFANDQIGALLAKRPTWNRLKSRMRAALATPVVVQYGGSRDTRSKRERIEDYWATAFLLSSDFFANGADESRARPPPGLQSVS
jgi:hypothetical protein